jgi:5'-nucleotidase/UDP-sugar diphosphatase
MKKILATCLMAIMASVLGAQPGKRIVILHTNDLHSRLAGYGPESNYTPLTTGDDNTLGGFARIAAIIKNESTGNSGITIVADAGDFLMGTIFQGLEPGTGFQLRLMKSMGYDVICIGNHEFDFGPGKLAEIVKSSVRGGEIPGLLLSNAIFDKNDPADDAIATLFNEGTIKRTLSITRGGLKFGFFSLMGIVADENAALAPPVKFSKQIATAKKMVKELEAGNCDIIICLSHSGVIRDKNGNWAGEDVDLAEKVKGIDVIISGHTHTRLEQPLIKNGIPIVQAGEYGQAVGKLTLIEENGKVRVEDYSLITVDDKIMGDPLINNRTEDQKKLITREILNPLGMDYDRKMVETNFLLECVELGDIKGSNLGPLVADAIHSYVNNHSTKGTNISMVAAGVIREKILPGAQTAPDIFRIMSMGSGNDEIPGYPLARLYVTGKELKSILEILQIAYKSDPAKYFYYSGFKAEFDPDRGMLKKISKIEIVDHKGKTTEVDFSKKNKTLYSITANSYILEFFGIIKKMSFGLINIVPKDSEGYPVVDMKKAVIDFDEKREGVQEGKEWLALIEYLTSMKDTNGNGLPEIDSKYREAIQTFFTVKK